MGSVWKSLVALIQLIWYNIVAAAETIRREKALRDAAEKQTQALEESRLREVEAELEKDIQRGKEILSSGDPAAGAREFLRDSFKDN